MSRVVHPKHYNVHPSGIECIDVIKPLPFCLGNAIKYAWRSDHNNGLEDIRKCAQYLIWFTFDDIMTVWMVRYRLPSKQDLQKIIDSDRENVLLVYLMRSLIHICDGNFDRGDTTIGLARGYLSKKVGSPSDREIRET